MRPAASVFLCGRDRERRRPARTEPLDQRESNKAKQIAGAAKAFEQDRTGHRPAVDRLHHARHRLAEDLLAIDGERGI